MKKLLAAILLFTFHHAVAQKWHSASVRLSEPNSPSHFYASVNYFSRYDTVPCTYVNFSSKRLQKGFKAVYVKNGYYTDNALTFGVFFDNRFRRAYHVRQYYFK